MFSQLSIQVKNSSLSIEKTYNIEETSFDSNNISLVKPFLAYARNGSITSVSKNYKYFV